MTLQPCINLGECYLTAAFDIYNNGLEQILEKTFPVNPQSFRDFGITYLFITTLACGVIQATKIISRDREYYEISSENGKKATYIDSLSLMLTPLWAIFELSYLIPMTKFYNPDVSWGIFQDKVRLAEYTLCKNTSTVQSFTEGFKPLAVNIIRVSNQSLNRMANVMGGTFLGMSIILSIQLISSCIFHRKIGLRDLLGFALIVGAFAISIFSLSQSNLINIQADMDKGIVECNNCYCNQTDENFVKRLNFREKT